MTGIEYTDSMVSLNEGWCLVLSGGGTKGVYHLGVWKALRELGISVGALVGTSIGALGAALLAQGAEDAPDVLIDSLTLDNLVSLPPQLLEDGRLRLDRASLAAARELFRKVVEKKGLDTSPLRRFLNQRIDETAIRRSGLDLGLVTVNLSTLSPRQVFLDEIEPGRLVDYLMASAAFPGFESPVIDGKRYVDGGLYDNIPYALARQRGYRRLIVSDVSGVGRNRRVEPEGAVTAYVKASIRMGGAFEFDRGFLTEYQQLGYLDTLRTFGRVGGSQYFVDLPAGASRPEPRLAEVEAAAHLLDVPRIARYLLPDLEAAVSERRAAAEARVAALLRVKGRPALSALLLTDEGLKALQAGPYANWRLAQELLPGRTGNALRKTLLRLYPELALAVGYWEATR